ncbi:2-oxoacid:acceptor oxidoreductase subunit alpha [Thiocapsa sp.]|uniref:2-oxoacid:acceptor oxidoreductase subunit alpha n=1 Tax=Thiocapsa sp. TaxID=2024551 RepID=UPI0025DD61A2|nr:2-oxoacid:acceptor oxidoreductase subunit alpha [Thiocapsa sp.]
MTDRPTLAGGATLAITGSGGSGAVTAGLILLAAVGRAGYFGLLGRSAGPQIRGGESAAMLRFGLRPIECMGDRFDLLVGLDWENVARFADELPLDRDSLILTDAQAGPIPEILVRSGAQVRSLPWKALADAAAEGRVNMVALGMVGAMLGLPLDALEAGARTTLGGKGGRVLTPSLDCIRSGYSAADAVPVSPSALAPAVARWNISGNEAAGLGAVRGGVRFVAAYPITPASEVLEWLAPRLELLGGSLLQAEDELASINMIIGSSFGGVPSLTATSGPGLSLMVEGLGLAVASETPVVVVNVQRGGPSTGIPTKSEQSDLNIALYGLHGDAPHLVLAALGIRDCIDTVEWAVGLAERLQTVAIVLSDQMLGQSRAIIDPPGDRPFGAGERPRLLRPIAQDADPDHRRYRPAPDGVSPMALPGLPGGMYTAEGLEHGAGGTPSSRAIDHAEQLDKRLHKLTGFDYGPDWAEIRGEGDHLLLTWGSSAGPVFEAAERLRDSGTPTRAIALRLLAPLQRDALLEAIGSAGSILVVEQNQAAQCFAYLHSQRALPEHARSFARPGPLPLRPAEIMRALTDRDGREET